MDPPAPLAPVLGVYPHVLLRAGARHQLACECDDDTESNGGVLNCGAARTTPTQEPRLSSEWFRTRSPAARVTPQPQPFTRQEMIGSLALQQEYSKAARQYHSETYGMVQRSPYRAKRKEKESNKEMSNNFDARIAALE